MTKNPEVRGGGRMALDLLASLRLDDGRQWGAAAEPWQWATAMAILDPDHPQKLHFDTRPKGGSKSTDLAGIAIAYLLTQAPAQSDSFAVAADEEQGRRLLDKIRGFVARTPELRKRLDLDVKRVTAPNGAKLHSLPADVASSEGLLTPWIVCDELPNWPETPTARGMWTSLASAIPKWPGMRLAIIGHAGDPQHWSYKVLERARQSPAWRTQEVPGPLPWISRAALEEQEALLTPSQYARRHLNQWVGGEDRLVTESDLRACVTLDGPLPAEPGRSYVIGLDLGLTNDRSVATVCHAERIVRDGAGTTGIKVVLDRQQVWAGTRRAPVQLGAVEEWLLHASREYGRCPIVFDVWQARLLEQNLKAKGVPMVPFVFSQASIGKMAVTLFNLLRSHTLALPNDTELLAEIGRARLQEVSPGTFRVDHGNGEHDDRVISLGLAAQHLAGTPFYGQGRAFMELWRREAAENAAMAAPMRQQPTAIDLLRSW